MLEAGRLVSHKPRVAIGSWMLVAAGLAALILPTIVSIAREHWSSDDGAHGPLILATGLWLIWRCRGAISEHRSPPRSFAWALALLPVLLVYAFSRAYNILSIESASLYLALIIVGFGYWGPRVMRLLWFPVLYLGFLIVPPGSLITEATQPLKIWLSGAAVELLYVVGYPVAQTGASIQIDQYQLLVETACAGLGSLLTLSALGLLYVHLRSEASFRHSIALLAAVIPLAVLANFIRILILVLLTYHVSESAAQGFAHDLAGMVMFVVGMVGMFGIDFLLRTFSRRSGRPA